MIRTLIRSLLLFLALACFLAASFALGLDGLRLASGGVLALTPMGEFWSALDPESLSATRQLVAPAVWDRVGVWLLMQPAWVVLGFLGFFLLILRPLRDKRRSLSWS